jgi:hypothetical protein
MMGAGIGSFEALFDVATFAMPMSSATGLELPLNWLAV